MEEQLFGGRTPLTRDNCLYGVAKRRDGSILVRVNHGNRGLRRIIKNNARDRSFFLDTARLEAYEDSIETAKNLLVEVIRAYRRHFEEGLFEFVLCESC